MGIFFLKEIGYCYYLLMNYDVAMTYLYTAESNLKQYMVENNLTKRDFLEFVIDIKEKIAEALLDEGIEFEKAREYYDETLLYKKRILSLGKLDEKNKIDKDLNSDERKRVEENLNHIETAQIRRFAPIDNYNGYLSFTPWLLNALPFLSINFFKPVLSIKNNTKSNNSSWKIFSLNKVTSLLSSWCVFFSFGKTLITTKSKNVKKKKKKKSSIQVVTINQALEEKILNQENPSIKNNFYQNSFKVACFGFSNFVHNYYNIKYFFSEIVPIGELIPASFKNSSLVSWTSNSLMWPLIKTTMYHVSLMNAFDIKDMSPDYINLTKRSTKFLATEFINSLLHYVLDAIAIRNFKAMKCTAIAANNYLYRRTIDDNDLSYLVNKPVKVFNDGYYGSQMVFETLSCLNLNGLIKSKNINSNYLKKIPYVIDGAIAGITIFSFYKLNNDFNIDANSPIGKFIYTSEAFFTINAVVVADYISKLVITNIETLAYYSGIISNHSISDENI